MVKPGSTRDETGEREHEQTADEEDDEAEGDLKRTNGRIRPRVRRIADLRRSRS